MVALKKMVTRQTIKNIEIPKEFGDEFQIIILQKENNQIENEQELSALYNTVIDNDFQEDKIWSKYL